MKEDDKKAKAVTDDQERAKAEEKKAKKQERAKRDKEHKEDIKVLDDLINNQEKTFYDLLQGIPNSAVHSRLVCLVARVVARSAPVLQVSF